MAKKPASTTGQKSPSLRLTARQSKVLAEAKSAVEILDAAGKRIGYLLHTPEITRFYTPAEFASLLHRAANPRPGKPLKEVLREAEATARAIHGSRSRAGV